jgi:tRNA A37 methylthiotransferase MiaB
MPRHPKSSPVACTLTGTDYEARLSWIEHLNATALRDYRRDGSRIELSYDPSAAAQVRELVEREKKCCPFLDFAIQDGDDAVILVIEAPHDASAAADAPFAPYVREAQP